MSGNSFQIKNFVSIVASMLNYVRGNKPEITDLAVGSSVRTLLEAPAGEIEETYMQFFNGIRDAIPVATFSSFSFEKLAAIYASGFIIVSVEAYLLEPLVIPKGTVFFTDDGRRYLTTKQVTWKTSELSVMLSVQAEKPGFDGNLSSGLIVGSPFFNDSFSINSQAIDGGQDNETQDEVQARFGAFVASLSRGTISADLYAASTAIIRDDDGNIIERVTRTGLTEIPGYVQVFIYTNRGAPSVELLAEAQKIIDGWLLPDGTRIPGYRAGGVRTDCVPMTERAVSFSGKVEMLPGFALTEDVKAKLKNIYSYQVTSIQPETTALLQDIITAMITVSGVKRLTSNSPENITCGASEALVVGSFEVSL